MTSSQPSTNSVGNVASNEAPAGAGNRGTTGVAAQSPQLSPRLLDLEDEQQVKYDEKLGMVSYDSLFAHFRSMDPSFPEVQLRAYFEALPLEPPSLANPPQERETSADAEGGDDEDYNHDITPFSMMAIPLTDHPQSDQQPVSSPGGPAPQQQQDQRQSALKSIQIPPPTIARVSTGGDSANPQSSLTQRASEASEDAMQSAARALL